MSKSPATKVVRLLDHKRPKPPEIRLDIAIPPKLTAADVKPFSYAVPAGKPKLVMAIGRGGSGKSTTLRWIAERAVDREGTVLATLAPNRTLVRYFPDEVEHPEGHSTSAGSVFLEGFLEAVALAKRNAVMDFPGDDTALLHLLGQGIDPVAMMASAGVEVVALFLLGPSVEGLTALAQLTALGFKPAATALVLNMGLTSDPTLPAQPQFERVQSHTVYRDAVARGAAEVWMPRLYSAAAIEDYQFSFQRACAAPELALTDRSRTHAWLQSMAASFGHIDSWLP